jgi:hypothetical protein
MYVVDGTISASDLKDDDKFRNISVTILGPVIKPETYEYEENTQLRIS